MSAIRSGLARATRAAVRSPAFTSTQAIRPISITSRLAKREIISEREVPVSSYTPDSKGAASGSADHAGEHYSIPVRRNPDIEVPNQDTDVEVVQPLKEEVYQTMPATLQKMSVMGKVVIITG
jgi:hypothetical protein